MHYTLRKLQTTHYTLCPHYTYTLQTTPWTVDTTHNTLTPVHHTLDPAHHTAGYQVALPYTAQHSMATGQEGHVSITQRFFLNLQQKSEDCNRHTPEGGVRSPRYNSGEGVFIRVTRPGLYQIYNIIITITEKRRQF